MTRLRQLSNTNIKTIEIKKANQKSIKNRFKTRRSFAENDKAIVEIVYSCCKATIPRAVPSAIEHAVIYVIRDEENKKYVRADAHRARAVRAIEQKMKVKSLEIIEKNFYSFKLFFWKT